MATTSKTEEKESVSNPDAEVYCYAELLEMAHAKGLRSIIVEIVQFPGRENEMTTVCKATVVMDDGKTFTDIADVSPANLNDAALANYLIRTCSTMAKARVLRDALGIGLIVENEGRKDTVPNTKKVAAPATINQLNAIEKLCKRLSRKFDTQIMAALNKVAASRLITQLNQELEKIS